MKPVQQLKEQLETIHQDLTDQLDLVNSKIQNLKTERDHLLVTRNRTEAAVHALRHLDDETITTLNYVLAEIQQGESND